VVWLITPYVLLVRRVSWRRLAPAALPTGAGMTGPGALLGDVDAALGRDVGGPVRVDRALLGWLVGYGLVLVVAAAGGAVIEARLRRRRPSTDEAGATCPAGRVRRVSRLHPPG
jgi:hypothetical protein